MQLIQDVSEYPDAWTPAIMFAHIALLELVVGRGAGADEIGLAMLAGGIFRSGVATMWRVPRARA